MWFPEGLENTPFTTKLGVDFSDRFDPTEHKIGHFHRGFLKH